MAWRLLPLLALASALDAFERIDLDELSRETENPDYFTLIYLYDLPSARSHHLFPVFRKVAETYQGAIRSLAVDCGRNDETCPPLLRDSLPSIFAYIPEGYDEKEGKPALVEREYSGVMDEDHVRGFVESNLVFLGDVVGKLTDQFLAPGNNKLNRALLFTEKDHIPLLYHSFAAKHKGRLDFGVVFPNATEVIERFHVTDYPTLLVLTKKGLEERYDGPIVPSEISEFLRKFTEPLKDKKRPVKKPKDWETEKSFREYDIHGVNSSNFAEALNATRNVVIALFARTNATEIWNPMVEKYSSMVTFLEMNCSVKEEADFAHKLGAKRFPSMRIFSTNRTKKSMELTFDTDADIDEQVLSYLNYTVDQLSDIQLNWYFENLKRDGKDGVLLISNVSEHFPFRIAASVPEFKANFRFAQYNRKSKELQQLLKAQNFPTIIAIKTTADKTFRFVEFTGNVFDFSLLKVFLQKLLFIPEAPVPRLSITRDRVEEYYSKSYKVLCEKKGGICVIGILPGSADLLSNNETYTALQVLQKEYRSDEDYHFGWFDGLCEEELREKFGVTQGDLPALVLYVPSRTKTARYKGTFTAEGIYAFLQESAGGKVKTTTLKDIAFADRNCGAEGAKRRTRHTDL